MRDIRHVDARTHEFLTVSIFITLAFLSACSSPTKEPKKETNNGLDQVHFESAKTAQKMKALDHCIRETVGPDWRYKPYGKSGNGYSASWCTGTGAKIGTKFDCMIVDDSVQQRDQQVIELGTMFYTFPKVFGLGVSALWVPPATGWAVLFSFDEDGKRIPYSSFRLYFYYYDKQSAYLLLAFILVTTIPTILILPVFEFNQKRKTQEKTFRCTLLLRNQ